MENHLFLRKIIEHYTVSGVSRLESNVDLKGKNVIIVGERDGVPGPAIETLVKSVGGTPALVQTQCFV
jgi:betaine reductase